ncbi:MAG: hypothetical protein ACLQMH_12560 [Solirubrobacteraceae bacterium]
MLRFGVEFADASKATNTADQPLANFEGGTTHSIIAAQAARAPAGPV